MNDIEEWGKSSQMKLRSKTSPGSAVALHRRGETRTVEIHVQSYPGKNTWDAKEHRAKIQIPCAPREEPYGTAMALEQFAMQLLDRAAKERALRGQGIDPKDLEISAHR